jgi:hypothetical protein
VSDHNVSGQAYGFLAMTPIRAGEEGPLRAYLDGLHDRGERPFERVSGTHMARWVILADFIDRPHYRQRRPDHLAGPVLLFSANLDGDLDSYLDRLAVNLIAEAAEVWGRCAGCPDPLTVEGLTGYLRRHQVDCGFFYAAYGGSTVEQVRAALSRRERLIAFATAHQGADPSALHRAFLAEFGASDG